MSGTGTEEVQWNTVVLTFVKYNMQLEFYISGNIIQGTQWYWCRVLTLYILDVINYDKL